MIPRTSSGGTPRSWRALLGALLPGIALAACFDRGDRWLSRKDASIEQCTVGDLRCTATLQECRDGPDGPAWAIADDCAKDDEVCAPSLLECVRCLPGETRCDGPVVERCTEDGASHQPERTCSTDRGDSCRDGACINLCARAAEERSNVGCEYWAVDLDNANVDSSRNAAAQQFAVVISNADSDLHADVTVERDDAQPGEDSALQVVARATVPPLSLRVFKLGPREVDGSPPGEFDTGTHTALTRAAYRIQTSVPVVAYQFNPLENVNVFSNDASLLKPVEALVTSSTVDPAYVVIGWPQTIASTEDPDTNFSASNPTDLRSFLTVVGTRPATTLRVHTTTRILGGGPIEETARGEVLELVIDPFDVVNLETDDFNADFTGSLIETDAPVVVFSGSEAADAPFFDSLSSRRCCADHLEEQLDPIRTAGKRFIASVSPNRARALALAGADLGTVPAPEYFRVIATTQAGARITTTLAAKASIELEGRGDFADIESKVDFMLESDEPVMFASISPSQAAAGIPRLLPGGDPSMIIVPPIEQFRNHYVFLTPDRYSFDFVRLLAPPDATIRFDSEDVTGMTGCSTRPADGLTDRARGRTPSFVIHECQLSFPRIDDSPDAEHMLSPGLQNDGVHEVVASRRVGVLVNGFDRHVSYGYAGGTELVEIVPR